MSELVIEVEHGGTSEQVVLELEQALLAGFTGRDQEAARAHVEELAAHGIAAPQRIPTIYAVPATRVTSSARIWVDGEDTSGEAEFVLLRRRERVLVGVASDHTDRGLEQHSIVKAKQCADKPVSARWWDLADVAGHWDELRLAAAVHVNGDWQPYQEGELAVMMHPEALLEEVEGRFGSPVEREAVFSGTLPIIGGEFVPGDRFRATLTDPVLDRELVCEYAVDVLPRFD